MTANRRDNIIVGLDIGTTKICCIVGEVVETGPQPVIDIVGIGTALAKLPDGPRLVTGSGARPEPATTAMKTKPTSEAPRITTMRPNPMRTRPLTDEINLKSEDPFNLTAAILEDGV